MRKDLKIIYFGHFILEIRKPTPERSSDLPKTRSKKWAGPKVTQHSTLIKKKKKKCFLNKSAQTRSQVS